MIPVLSSEPIWSGFTERQNRRSEPLIDYEMGGPSLNGPSSNFNTHLWIAESDGAVVTVRREDSGTPTQVLSDSNIEQIALGFSQLMVPHIAYTTTTAAKFFWFDTLTGQMETMILPAGSTSMRLCMDEKRGHFISGSDLLLSYERGTHFYVRAQRDRFGIEYDMGEKPGTSLVAFGKNRDNRLQWQFTQ